MVGSAFFDFESFVCKLGFCMKNHPAHPEIDLGARDHCKLRHRPSRVLSALSNGGQAVVQKCLAGLETSTDMKFPVLTRMEAFILYCFELDFT